MDNLEKPTLDDLLTEWDVIIPPGLHAELVIYRENDGELGYYFKDGCLECPFYPGYFYIPGFSRYVISRTGELMTVTTGHVKKWTISRGGVKNVTGGYFVGHGIHDIGERRGLSRHRALCLAFKHPMQPVKKLHVNHLDGKPGNDVLENLEFCLPSQNVQHAYDAGLYPNKTVPVELWNWITGEKRRFNSITDAAEFIGCGWGRVEYRLRQGPNRRWEDGWRLKTPNDHWGPLDETVELRDDTIEVVCKNVFDNKAYIFASIACASKFTGIGQGTIGAYLRRKTTLPCSGWLFRPLDGFEGWPLFSDKHLVLFREYQKTGTHKDGIEVYDCETNSHMFYTLDEASRVFNLSPITVSKLARYEGVKDKRFKFKLFRVRDIQCPVQQ